MSEVEKQTGCSEEQRFIIELELINCLANPQYLNWLAQNKYLQDPSFIAYLNYLQYWKKPEYAKYVLYPHCIYFLDLLQNEEFRKVVAKPAVADFIHTQQYRYWMEGRQIGSNS